MKDLLIVDDEKILSKNIKKFANKKNYQADVAFTVNEALDLLKKNQYRVILLDVNLEDSPCGLTLIEHVNDLKTNLETKIVVVSGHVDPENVTRLYPELWSALSKPIKFRDIEKLLKSV